MKRFLSLLLVLVCILALSGCSGSKEKVWNWAQNLDEKDITYVEMWNYTGSDFIVQPLDDTQILELVTLLNDLPKDSFTYNKHNHGGTPTYGIRIEVGSEAFRFNQANGSQGSLELDFEEKLWWIDNEALSDFVLKVTGAASAE